MSARKYVATFVGITVLTFPFSSVAQWVQASSPFRTTVYALAAHDTFLFAGTIDNGVSVSTDNGTTWSSINKGLTNPTVYALAASGGNLYAGTRGSGVFRSTDGGTSWTDVNRGLTDLYVAALAADGTNLFAGTYASGGGVFRSTDDGANWTRVNNGLTNTLVYALAVRGTDVFAGTYGGGVFRSTDSGLNWTAVNTGLASTVVWSVLIGPNGPANLYAGTDAGVFLSTNDGTNWVAKNSGLNNTAVHALAIGSNQPGGAYMLAGTYGYGGSVFLSTNNGGSWTAANSGLTQTYIYALVIRGVHLFAGTDGGLWRCPLSGTISDIEVGQDQLPIHYVLGQNYPNPFNPSTSIRYQLSVRSLVTLKVFDVLGKEIATLAKEPKGAGSYTVQWNALNVPSGVYFYRLLASPISSGPTGNPLKSARPGVDSDGSLPGFIQTMKMSLIK